MKKLFCTLGKFTLITLCGLFFSFLIINLFLGCESWDKELWDEYHSCLTPNQVYKALINE